MERFSDEDYKRLWFLRLDDALTLADFDQLERELAQAPAAVVGPARIKLIKRRAEVKAQLSLAASDNMPGDFKAGVQVKLPPNGAATTAVAASYGLPVPDGRPLYAYRLTDVAFARLSADLVAKGLDGAERLHGPALFVLWAAEWCRRAYAGGGITWADLVAPLGWPADQGRLRDLTRKGLQAWGRNVLALTQARQYLGTLAREGGFPAAAIRDGGQGWAQRLLERVVAGLMALPEPDEDQALELARQGDVSLPALYRDDEFYHLAADLALAIVRLRQMAGDSAQSEHVSITVWLHMHRPGWAQDLPIVTGDAVADRLVDHLLKVEPVAMPSVTIDRLLVLKGPVWQEAVRLCLDGMVDGGNLPGAEPSDGRLRAFPAGAFANHVAGELALFDPPGLGETQWQVRASRLGRSVHSVPFAVPVAFDLRGAGHTVATFAPTRGKPRRGQMLVAAREGGSDENPTALRILGSGGGSYRADPVFVQLPESWRVQALGEERAEFLGAGTPGQALWRIHLGATVIDDTGDLLRVRCGQSQDASARLELVGETVPWAQVLGTVDLFAGAPTVLPPGGLYIGATLAMRAIGARTWQLAPQRLPIGHYELAWRRGNEVLDRRRVAVLPAQARLDRTGSGIHTRYHPSGFGPVALEPHAAAPVRVNDGGEWVARGQTVTFQFIATLSWPDGPPLDVAVRFPCAPAIIRADGTVLPQSHPILLDDLAGLTVAGEGEFQLLGTVTGADPRAPAIETVWTVKHAMPLSALADDLRDMLQQASSIDSAVRLEMVGLGGPNWHVRQFPNRLRKDGLRLLANAAVVDADVALCGRWFGNPSHERIIAPYSLLHDLNHRPLAMPDDMGGLWIVYLRAGDRVLTRPQYLDLPASMTDPVSPLGQIMALPLGPMLNRALASFLDLAEQDGTEAQAAVEALIGLVASLRGLAPATFQIIRELANRPVILARMAMLATAAQLPPILALEQDLPFAWFLIPQEAWDCARRLRLEALHAVLVTIVPDTAMALALEGVGSAEQALVAADPLLALALRKPDPVDLRAATQAFLQRARDRITDFSRGRYRQALPDLPAYLTTFDSAVLDVLDAPCAAARAALGHWRPQPELIRHIKSVARRFPTWFSQAFAATRLEHTR